MRSGGHRNGFFAVLGGLARGRDCVPRGTLEMLWTCPGVEQAAKRRKRRKKKKNSSDQAARAAALVYPAKRILLDLELWGAEIDQQAVLNARRTQGDHAHP